MPAFNTYGTLMNSPVDIDKYPKITEIATETNRADQYTKRGAEDC